MNLRLWRWVCPAIWRRPERTGEIPPSLHQIDSRPNLGLDKAMAAVCRQSPQPPSESRPSSSECQPVCRHLVRRDAIKPTMRFPQNGIILLDCYTYEDFIQPVANSIFVFPQSSKCAMIEKYWANNIHPPGLEARRAFTFERCC